MIAYPSGLPYELLRDGYEKPNSGLPLLKSQMQSGKIRQRRQFTLRVTPMQAAIYFTPAQLVTWRNFLLVILGDGAAEFTMPIWNTASRAYETKTVQIKDGAEGVSEKPFGVDQTLVSFVLLVRGL